MTDGPGLGLQADVGANIIFALGSVREEIQRMRAENAEDRVQRALSRIKNYIPLTQTVVLDGSGNGVIDMGTPALGRVWTVRQLATAVQGFELVAPAAAFIAGWYIGVNVPGNTTRFTSQWRLTQYNPPVVNTYTADIHQARMGEHLFAMITGGTAGNTIVANAVVLDEPMKVGIPTQQGF